MSEVPLYEGALGLGFKVEDRFEIVEACLLKDTDKKLVLPHQVTTGAPRS